MNYLHTNLIHLHRTIEEACVDEVSKSIANIVLNSTKDTRPQDAKAILEKDWKIFQCTLNLTLKTIVSENQVENDSSSFVCKKSPCTQISKTSEFKATFDFFHFLILAKKYKLLFHFLDQQKENSIVTKPVGLISLLQGKVPVREDAWIDGANYIHTASKYSAEALEILLQDPSKRFHALISAPSKTRKIHPLHLAAMNQSSLATR